MKVFVCAAFATLMLVGAAAAQPAEGEAPATTAPPVVSSCPPIPSPPADLPDGAAADAREMTAGGEAFNAWIAAADGPVSCLRDEAQAAINRATALREQFNTAAETITTTREAWVAEIAEFEARSPRRR